MAIEKGERPFDPAWDDDTNYNMAHDGATFANYEFSKTATHHCNRLTDAEIAALPLDQPADADYLCHKSIVSETDYAEHCLLLGVRPNVEAFCDIVRHQQHQLNILPTSDYLFEEQEDNDITMRGDHTNPNVITSQESRPATIAACVPTSNLVPKQGRHPIPGLVRTTNPDRQQNGFKTVTGIGKVSFTARTAQAKDKPQLAKPSPAPSIGVTPLTPAQLANRNTTKGMIAASAAALGLFLPSQATKAAMVQGYKIALANRNIPGAAPTTKPMLAPASAPQNAVTSTWVIRRKNGHNDEPFTKPFQGDATTLARYLQDAITRNSPGPTPPITLLGGRWGTNPNNFVLIFAGQPLIESV